MRNEISFMQRSENVVKCHDCGLRRGCFPKHLSAPQIAALEGIIGDNHSYQRGDFLYRGGDFLHKLIVVKSGSIKCGLLSEHGAEQIVGFHFAGDLLGLDYSSNRQTLTSAEALETTHICTIPYPSFVELGNQIPELHKEMVTRLSNEIAASQQLMLSMNNHSAEQRVVIFLQDLANRQHNRGLSKEHLHLSMSRMDIANYLGLASATVSRIISKFEREGLLQVENRHLQLTNYQGLLNTVYACA